MVQRLLWIYSVYGSLNHVFERCSHHFFEYMFQPFLWIMVSTMFCECCSIPLHGNVVPGHISECWTLASTVSLIKSQSQPMPLNSILNPLVEYSCQPFLWTTVSAMYLNSTVNRLFEYLVSNIESPTMTLDNGLSVYCNNYPEPYIIFIFIDTSALTSTT